jgi:hypothetical protein
LQGAPATLAVIPIPAGFRGLTPFRPVHQPAVGAHAMELAIIRHVHP